MGGRWVRRRRGGRFQMGRRVRGGTIGRIMYDLSYFRTRGLRVHLLCFCKRPRGPREIRWAFGLFMMYVASRPHICGHISSQFYFKRILERRS